LATAKNSSSILTPDFIKLIFYSWILQVIDTAQGSALEKRLGTTFPVESDRAKLGQTSAS
jgi:hypothetical protein